MIAFEIALSSLIVVHVKAAKQRRSCRKKRRKLVAVFYRKRNFLCRGNHPPGSSCIGLLGWPWGVQYGRGAKGLWGT